jgi:hypothetical protein
MTEEELRTQYNVKKTGTTMTTQNINDKKENPDGFPKYFQTILNKFGREDEIVFVTNLFITYMTFTYVCFYVYFSNV